MNIGEFKESGFSIYVEKDGKEIFSSKEGMLKPLLESIKQTDMRGVVVYDKVVGRAAALLFAYAEVKKVYGVIMSEAAIDILKKYNISHTACKVVKNILNREGNGTCPMEILSFSVKTPEEFYRLVTRLK